MKFPSLLPSRALNRFSSLAFACLMLSTTAHAAAPGGFLESDETSVARANLTATQIAAFMPATRGSFTFPAPYNTQGVRITQASDCSGQDCVDMTYNYWKNMSNSTGSNTLYILVGLDQNRGGAGPTLFSYDKPSGTLTDLGALFPSNSSYSWYSTEGMYFSYSMATKIYIVSGTQLLRYDVLAHTFETVVDVSSQYPNTVLHQANSSNDDDVHSATLEDNSSYAALGCVAYKVSTKQYFYFPVQGNFDECQIDKSGRYLEIKEKLPTDPCTSCDEDDVIEDLQTGLQTVLLDQNGAGGHSDLGYGTMVAVDNWNNDANAWRAWDLSAPLVGGGATNLTSLLQGGLVYHDLNWGVFEPSHISFENAVPVSVTPINKQYACGGAINAATSARSNDIQCFLLDTSVPAASEQTLVVAPVMSDLNATGGNATCPSCTDYAKDPKGNIDPTGQYFFWTSNAGSSRLDAFIVKIPYQVLTGGSGSGGGSTPPTVAITSPTSGTSLSGTVSVSANASDSTGVINVQFQLDGANLGSPVSQAPYSVSWNTSTASTGSHTLTATATDTAGLTATSTAVSVSIAANVNPPAISAVTASVTGPSSATVTWTTDQASSTQVSYGTTASYGTSTTLSPTLVTTHSVALSGLTASTTYHYQVASTNSSGEQSLSSDMTFTTQAGGGTTLPNPIAYWNLNAGSGTTATDNSGDRHTATLVNSPAWTSGISGDALVFNGTNSYATVPSASTLNGYPLTVSVWVKTGSTSGLHGIMNKYAASSMNGYQIFINNGDLCAWYFKNSSNYIWDGSGCTLSTPGFADNNWHMVTFVVSSTGGTLYVDGVMKASQAWTGTAGATTSSQVLSFARYPGVSSPYLAAALDDARIYNQALSGAQVATLYNSMPQVLPVAWTNLVNLTANGGSLQKTGGCDGCEDATANSQQQIAAGASGYLEFTASETNTLRYAGLTNVNAGIGSLNLNFGIRLQGGDAAVYENGVYKTDLSFASGDVFRVAVGAGVVNYYKNGTVFYTSTVAPSYPLQVSVTICDVNGTITNAVIKSH